MCCIENDENVLNTRHIKSVDLRYLLYVHLGTTYKQNNFALCVRVRFSISLAHLRFAYFKAIIVFILNALRVFFSFALFFVACPYLIHLIRKWMFLFFSNKEKKKRGIHLTEQLHGYLRVRLHLCVNVCVCLLFLSLHSLYYPLFLTFFFSLEKANKQS